MFMKLQNSGIKVKVSTFRLSPLAESREKLVLKYKNQWQGSTSS